MDWLYTPSPERHNERDEDGASSQGPIQINDGNRGEQRAKQEYDSVESEEKFEASDELLTIRVPKAVFDKAAVELVANLRKELRAAKDLLFKKDAELEELQNELSDAKALIANFQSGETEDSEAVLPSENLHQQCIFEVQHLPHFRGSYTRHQDSKPVSFIDMDLCTEMGWERTFRDRFETASNSTTSNSIKPLYIPGRTFFVNSQHAIAIIPKTQTNSEYDLELLSSFDEVHGEERAFFFDRAIYNRGERDIYYAGTYRIVNLSDICPQGVELKDAHRPFRKQHTVDCIVDSVADAQVQRPMLGKSDIKKLVKSGDIKLELIGLQCVGFDRGLYDRVRAKKAGGKRKQPSAQVGHGDSHPPGKRRKKE